MDDISKQQAVEWDKVHCWHPFTQQREWCDADHEPLMVVKGKGVWLQDMEGRKYIDGNASIWTNIHGHQHPRLNQAITDQLQNVAHSSFLGLGHPLASELASRLAGFFDGSSLQKVFFSDNGSTAIESALKMAIQYRIQSGQPERTSFVAFHAGYHGDTIGAASLGGVDAFFSRFRKFGMQVHFVKDVEELERLDPDFVQNLAGVVVEPLVQGVNQIHVWPTGMLAKLRDWTEHHGVHLILDEVMTGFGRTGEMFACQKEEVVPDFLCLAKGLTAGYLPMAATLVRNEIYDAFLGDASKVFYYGHSYTANPLGCAVALASLDVFHEEQTLIGVREKAVFLEQQLNLLEAGLPHVYQTRRCGLVAGIELRQWDGTSFPKEDRVGQRVCLAARDYGLLTRPILDTLVFLPPLSISRDEIEVAFAAFEAAIRDVLG